MIRWLLLAVAVGAGGMGVYLLWRHMKEKPPALPLHDETLIEAAAEQLEKAVAERVPSGRLIMLPIRGDGTGRITYLIKNALITGGRFDVVLLKKEEEKESSITALLKSALKRFLKPKEGKALLKQKQADALLSIATQKTDTQKRLAYTFSAVLDTKKGRIGPFKVEESMAKSLFDLRYLSCSVRSHSLILRLIYFLLFVGLLPWLLYKPCERVLSLERNLYNGLLLAGLTAAGLFWTFFLLGLGFYSFFSTASFLIALPVVLFYNWWALDVIDHMRR